MGIRHYRPLTPGSRQRTVSDFAEITTDTPEKSLVFSSHRHKGRNNRGVITSRRRGGGHKRLYRLIDFYRENVENEKSRTVERFLENSVSKLFNDEMASR